MDADGTRQGGLEGDRGGLCSTLDARLKRGRETRMCGYPKVSGTMLHTYKCVSVLYVFITKVTNHKTVNNHVTVKTLLADFGKICNFCGTVLKTWIIKFILIYVYL